MIETTTGFVLERPRSIGAIIAATGGLYRRYPVLFAVLAFAVVAPYTLLVLAATGYGPLRRGHENVGVYWLLELLRTSLVTPLVSALHMHAIAMIGDARRPRLGEVARRGVQALPVVAAAAVMSWLAITLGFLFLIVPGILLAVRWAVVAQAAALEDGGWIDALRSSSRLTATHFRHVLGLMLLVGIPMGALRFGIGELPLGDSSGAGSVAVGVVLDSAIASFAALTLALLYFDLRARPAEPERAPREHPRLRDLD